MLQPFFFSASYKKITTMKTLLTFLFLSVLLYSCKDDDFETLEKNTTSVDLYVGGADDSKACYWKNGQKFVLPGGDGLYVRQIISENNQVYVLGGAISEYIDNFPTHLYFWKNGTKYNLDQYLQDVVTPNPNNQNFTPGLKMVVDNGNIYFIGYIKNPNSTSSQDQYSLCSWKNGIRTVIDNFPVMSVLRDYTVANNDVYVSAPQKNFTYDPSTNISTWQMGYYKNGIYNSLPNATIIRSIYSDNNGVSTLYKNYQTNEMFVKNLTTNITTLVPTNIFQNQIYSSTSSGNDAYYIGEDFYYKNNTLIQINDPNGYNKLHKFIVKDQNIYTTRSKDILSPLKVFVNDIEVQSIPQTSVNAPNVSGFTSLYVD